MMRTHLIALACACACSQAFAADDLAALKAELARLSQRLEQLERHNQALEKSLSSERLSDHEPELSTRLKAVEFQTLGMQKQTRQIEALEGISVEGSVTAVAQRIQAQASASGQGESRVGYRGDLSVTLPGDSIANTEGIIFAHLRFGQGAGVGLRSTYTSTANSAAFETGAGPDDSFAVLAQAWYQLQVPLGDGPKAQSRHSLTLTAGKIDPFGFFDQNKMADDESSRFLNNAFMHNPLLDSGGDIGADAYGFAPGLIAQYRNTENKGGEWGISLGILGSGPGANFSGSLRAPTLIVQAERQAVFNYLPGTYRAYAWTHGRAVGFDGIERRHAGWGLSIDQQLSESITVFSRYGHQTRGAVRFDRAITVGAEWAGNAWGRGADGVGLALGALRTASGFAASTAQAAQAAYVASGSEHLAEAYYRAKINAKLELGPHLQWIHRPGGDGNTRSATVLGLRAKLSL